MPNVNTDRFAGFAELYDSVRPQPPHKVVEIAGKILGREHVEAVADIGSGTGLSTRIWTQFSSRVVGIEPTIDMIERSRLRNPGITFLNTNSYDTTLDARSVDLVVCSQSFHWMEPSKTLEEVDRILKPEGLFVVYDCQWPVTWYWHAEQAYSELIRKARSVERSIHELGQAVVHYPKDRHIDNMRKSAVFAYCGTVLFDNTEPCDAERFIGIALSQGQVQDVLKYSPGELQTEIQILRDAAAKSTAAEMRVGYTLHFGVKKSRAST